jgi:hypothetical protein
MTRDSKKMMRSAGIELGDALAEFVARGQSAERGGSILGLLFDPRLHCRAFEVLHIPVGIGHFHSVVGIDNYFNLSFGGHLSHEHS